MQHHKNLAQKVRPRFLQVPRDIEVPTGENIELSCEAVGTPQPTIVWSHDGQELEVKDNLQVKLGDL